MCHFGKTKYCLSLHIVSYVVVHEYLNIQLTDDPLPCNIQSVTPLPDKGFVLCDYGNRRIKRVFPDGKVTLLCQEQKNNYPVRVKYIEKDHILLVAKIRINLWHNREPLWKFMSLDGTKLHTLKLPADCKTPGDLVIAPNGNMYVPNNTYLYIIRDLKNPGDCIRHDMGSDFGWSSCAAWVSEKLVICYEPDIIVAFTTNGKKIWRRNGIPAADLAAAPNGTGVFVASENKILHINNEVSNLLRHVLFLLFYIDFT